MTRSSDRSHLPDDAPADAQGRGTSFGRGPDADERAILTRARAGDQAACSVLSERYRDSLVRFCRRYLGSPEDAEDMAQDVLTKTFAAGRWPERDAVRPWLFRVARNHCLNQLRQSDRGGPNATLFPESQLQDARTGPQTRATKHELSKRAAEALCTLPLQLAEVLTLRYFEDMSRAEIADVLELSVSGVKKRLVAARTELARRVSTLQ